jgi:hypothetical protein
VLTGFAVVAGGIVVGVLVMSMYRWYRHHRDPTGWQFYNVLPFCRVRPKDGPVARFNDLVMRRYLDDGLWEYRWPTQEEADD